MLFALAANSGQALPTSSWQIDWDMWGAIGTIASSIIATIAMLITLWQVRREHKLSNPSCDVKICKFGTELIRKATGQLFIAYQNNSKKDIMIEDMHIEYVGPSRQTQNFTFFLRVKGFLASRLRLKYEGLCVFYSCNSNSAIAEMCRYRAGNIYSLDGSPDDFTDGYPKVIPANSIITLALNCNDLLAFIGDDFKSGCDTIQISLFSAMGYSNSTRPIAIRKIKKMCIAEK